MVVVCQSVRWPFTLWMLTTTMPLLPLLPPRSFRYWLVIAGSLSQSVCPSVRPLAVHAVDVDDVDDVDGDATAAAASFPPLPGDGSELEKEVEEGAGR